MPSPTRRPAPSRAAPAVRRSLPTVAAAERTPPARVLAAAEPAVHALWSGPLDRVQADLAQLNLCYLQLAREFARNAREVALTRLGLDAEACAALERLSLADVQTLAQSRALIFGLRVAPGELAAQAALARSHPAASEARLLLAARQP